MFCLFFVVVRGNIHIYKTRTKVMIHEVIQSITPEQAIELIAFAQDCISASQKKSGEIMNGTLSEGSRIVAFIRDRANKDISLLAQGAGKVGSVVSVAGDSLVFAAMQKIHEYSGNYIISRNGIPLTITLQAYEKTNLPEATPMSQGDLDFMQSLLSICSDIEESSSGSVEVKYDNLSYNTIQFLADVYEIKSSSRSKAALLQCLKDRNMPIKVADILQYLRR